MEEIDFEQLKLILEGKNDIEIIVEIKKPVKVKIQDKTYKITGIKKRDLLEYFDNVSDQDQQKDSPVPGVQVHGEQSPKEEVLSQASCEVPEGNESSGVHVQPPSSECQAQGEGVQIDSGGVPSIL